MYNGYYFYVGQALEQAVVESAPLEGFKNRGTWGHGSSGTVELG